MAELRLVRGMRAEERFDRGHPARVLAGGVGLAVRGAGEAGDGIRPSSSDRGRAVRRVDPAVGRLGADTEDGAQQVVAERGSPRVTSAMPYARPASTVAEQTAIAQPSAFVMQRHRSRVVSHRSVRTQHHGVNVVTPVGVQPASRVHSRRVVLDQREVCRAHGALRRALDGDRARIHGWRLHRRRRRRGLGTAAQRSGNTAERIHRAQLLFEFAHIGGRCRLRPLAPQDRAGDQALCRRDLVDTLAETAVQIARRPTLLSRTGI